MALAGYECRIDGSLQRGALVDRISWRLHLWRSSSDGTGYTDDGSFDAWHLHNRFRFGSLSIPPQNDSRWSGALRGSSNRSLRPLPESRGRGSFPGVRMRWQLGTDPPLGMERSHQLNAPGPSCRFLAIAFFETIAAEIPDLWWKLVWPSRRCRHIPIALKTTPAGVLR